MEQNTTTYDDVKAELLSIARLMGPRQTVGFARSFHSLVTGIIKKELVQPDRLLAGVRDVLDSLRTNNILVDDGPMLHTYHKFTPPQMEVIRAMNRKLEKCVGISAEAYEIPY